MLEALTLCKTMPISGQGSCPWVLRSTRDRQIYIIPVWLFKTFLYYLHDFQDNEQFQSEIESCK